MNAKEIVLALMNAIQKGDFAAARPYLADDFQYSGPVPEPLNGEAWLSLSMNLKKAFPNLEYHFKVDGVDDEVVYISSELKGTHKAELDLTRMQMGLIAPTRRSFATVHHHGKAIVKDDKVSAWTMEPNSRAGLPAILRQLGVVPTLSSWPR